MLKSDFCVSHRFAHEHVCGDNGGFAQKHTFAHRHGFAHKEGDLSSNEKRKTAF